MVVDATCGQDEREARRTATHSDLDDYIFGDSAPHIEQARCGT